MLGSMSECKFVYLYLWFTLGFFFLKICYIKNRRCNSYGICDGSKSYFLIVRNCCCPRLFLGETQDIANNQVESFTPIFTHSTDPDVGLSSLFLLMIAVILFFLLIY